MNISTEAAILSLEQTIAALHEEVAEIDQYLANNPQEVYGEKSFTVQMRLLQKDGSYSTPSGLRQVGEGFNFNGSTPSTVYAMSYQDAGANTVNFNRNAYRAGKTDVEYQVTGLRHFFRAQREHKAEVAASLRKQLNDFQQRIAAAGTAA